MPETRSKLEMMRFFHSALELIAVIFFLASYCHGAPIRDKNKPNGSVGKWRKLSWATTKRQYNKANKNKESDDHTDDIGGFLSPPRSFFTWEAFIHGPTGVASSNERSGPFLLTTDKKSPWYQFKKGTSHTACDSGHFSVEEEDERRHRMMTEEEHLIVETSRQFVNSWSDFLCQGTISLGILRCMKEKNSNRKRKRKAIWRRPRRMSNPTVGVAATDNSTPVSSSSLLARFAPLPVKLLQFGKAVESSSPFSTYNHIEKGGNQKNLVVLGSWDIPLQGGTLVLEEDKSQKQKSGPSSSNSPDYCGKLMFAIVKTTNEDQGGNSIESCRHINSYEIITGIRDYRPWLAGGGYTSNSVKNQSNDNVWESIKYNRETTTRRLCHGFYLSTQSMVHAYVTWRFHHAWKKQLVTAVRTTTKKATEKENG